MPREIQSAEQVQRTIVRIAHQIIEKTALDAPDGPRVALIGIPSGGVPLAARLAEQVERHSGRAVATGELDVTLYRDDLKDKPHRALRPTRLPEGGIDGALVVLVDDVLYSGRTVRAALDALRDFGRPAALLMRAASSAASIWPISPSSSAWGAGGSASSRTVGEARPAALDHS